MWKEQRPLIVSSPAHADDPVRRGFSVQDELRIRCIASRENHPHRRPGAGQAQARTHYPKSQLLRGAGTTSPDDNKGRGVWVPAFALGHLHISSRLENRLIIKGLATRREPKSAGATLVQMSKLSAVFGQLFEKTPERLRRICIYASAFAGTTPESAASIPPPQSTPRHRATARRGGRCGRSRDGRSLLRRRRRDGSR
ncbi:hypothetical protein ACVIHH_001391 [Bradyrhizobium sp. USDA 4518]